MQTARLMIAAPQGRSGKTTVAIGLCAALRESGIKVKPFKKGPDYIDPSWLTAAAGVPCSNIDLFMFDRAALVKGFREDCAGADLALIEASMGLYDSPQEDGEGSSAWLARELQAPIILVVNCSRMTRSAAAMVCGYINFEPGTPIAGVILNHVGNPRHESTIVKAIERHCGIPVLGALPRDDRLAIRERHLGIVPLQEQAEAATMIDRIGSIVRQYADIGRIVEIARGADRLPRRRAPRNDSGTSVISSEVKSAITPVKIGVLADKAFSFYYPENLDALQQNGAQLIYIDSLRDTRLPAIDALYIGGGFPELYAAELEANAGLRQDISEGVESGLPLYAECAGLIYLCRSVTSGGRAYNMCGVIPADAAIEQKPQGHGYVSAEVTGQNPFFPQGALLKGHEFHHSRLLNTGSVRYAYRVTRGNGIDGRNDGIVYKNV
ncbi:MAG: cobyrinate a,c-diamide synthase, partial [Chloroflexi bacterium]|nr:cobyrinate a,c-diamide synthase [Chloroflexota bacterium]